MLSKTSNTIPAPLSTDDGIEIEDDGIEIEESPEYMIITTNT
jgi:hypothetical protein